jgi:integrase
VTTHVHALRAAFAVAFDETYPGDTLALKEWLGHSRYETTMVYLRRKDKAKAHAGDERLVVLPVTAPTGYAPSGIPTYPAIGGF